MHSVTRDTYTHAIIQRNATFSMDFTCLVSEPRESKRTQHQHSCVAIIIYLLAFFHRFYKLSNTEKMYTYASLEANDQTYSLILYF